jgi:branched-chain amino acid transport system permease protein
VTTLEQSRTGTVERFGLIERMQLRVREIGARGLAFTAVAVVVSSVYFIAADGLRLYWIRFLDALANGFIYGAVALALVLIYKATGIINFAQGSMAMFFTFVAWVLAREQGVPVWLSIILAMLFSALFAAGFERIFIRPFDPSNHLPIIMVTIALLSIVEGLAIMIWFADPKAFPSPFPSNPKTHYVDLWGARIFYSTIGIWLTVIAMTVFISLLLSKTKIGLAFRSVSSNLESSRLVGINVGRTLQFGWALAAAIGTLAGCLVLSDSKTYLDPSFMAKTLVFAFAAATIGGLDSLVGALIGGILVGQLQTMVGGYLTFIGSDLVLGVTLLVVIVVMLVRPNGLFGKVRVERV